MSKIPVSVCIIAKNEEKFLEECLKRIKPYGFEIIVTDTGSTDRTKEIAKKYADKVLDFKWINDFSAARNYCARYASNNWIISLDCDEFVENINTYGLLALMKQYPQGVGSMQMKILLFSSDGDISYNMEQVARIYNKKYYQFENSIHEQISAFKTYYDKYGNPLLRTFNVPIEVVHQGYVQSKEIMDQKQERNLKLLLAELDKDKDNAYMQFQVAQSFSLLKRYDEALPYYEKCLSYNQKGNLIYVQLCIIELVKTYVRLGRVQDAIDCMAKYEESCKTAKFSFLQGCFWFDSQEWMKSLFYFLKTINMPDMESLGNDLIICYEKIIDVYKALGAENEATEFKKKYQQCLEEQNRVLKTMDVVHTREEQTS